MKKNLKNPQLHHLPLRENLHQIPLPKVIKEHELNPQNLGREKARINEK